MHHSPSITIKLLLESAVLLITNSQSVFADDFNQFLQPLFNTHCGKCHGKTKKVKGKVNLLEIKTADHRHRTCVNWTMQPDRCPS